MTASRPPQLNLRKSSHGWLNSASYSAVSAERSGGLRLGSKKPPQ